MMTSLLLLSILLFISALFHKAVAAADPSASFFSTTSSAEKEPFTAWLATDNASLYDLSTFLSTTADPTKGMATFWKVNGDTFHLAFATMATGWAAFGIAEAGGMFGADIVSFSTANPDVLVDGYILDDRQVRVDNNSQDWTLISSVVEDGWIIVEATRKITTGDTQDNALKNDKELWGAPTRLIAAWGDTEEMSYHGDNRSSSSVRIFADPSSNSLESDAVVNALEKNSDGYFDVVNGAYEIPARETYYEYICKSYDELKEQFGGDMTDITMIAATPIITEETRQFVHHFIAMAIPSCDNQDRFKREQIYGWAPGDVGMVLPDDVGFPMFDTEDNQAIMIEIHYNNPKLISGMEDSSGVRFYYTNAPRLHDAAILMLGDPMLGLYGVAINDGLTMHEFSCPGECSSLFLDEPVTVISEKLHMHKTGVRMVNEAIRGGEVFHTATVEIFDFEQQGGFQPQQDSYQLQAGDKFRTTCYYKDGTVFKEGSQDEMCIAFLLYYPRKKFAGIPFVCPYPGRFPCAEEYVSTDLNGYEDLGRVFGTSGNGPLSNVTLPQPPVTSMEPLTPSNSNTGENKPAYAPISTDEAPETENPTSKAESTKKYCLFVITLSSAAMFITLV
mmetsp:Transcript_10951/g.18178  ORF Transcript_10951/g.18178 Transcript_10951/m.18178 type:complete len:618 (-) Transcript_10951:1445-3298(-)